MQHYDDPINVLKANAEEKEDLESHNYLQHKQAMHYFAVKK